MNVAEHMNSIMSDTSIPFTERMQIVRKIKQDHEDSQNNPPFQILNEEDSAILLESLEETQPHRDLGGVRLHVGKVFGSETLAVSLNNGQMLVVG